MKLSTILRKAANAPGVERGMCRAICRSCLGDPRLADQACAYLEDFFAPDSPDMYAWWGWHWGDDMPLRTDADSTARAVFVGDCRVLALLFAAAMARAEGL